MKDKRNIAIVGGVLALVGTLLYLRRAGAGPGTEVSVDILSASWDKSTYAPGELASLTVGLKSNSDLDCRGVVRNRLIEWEQLFSLPADVETTVTFSGYAPDEVGGLITYLDLYINGESIRQIKMPDLVVVETVEGAKFIMLGGISREALWSTGVDQFIMNGELMNVGNIEGTIQPHGWWRVGNKDIYDKPFDPVTLGPGESLPLSFTISSGEMIQAEQEAGFGYGSYYPLSVILSTYDYALHGAEWGWQYTMCTVYIEEPEVPAGVSGEILGITGISEPGSPWNIAWKVSFKNTGSEPFVAELRLRLVEKDQFVEFLPYDDVIQPEEVREAQTEWVMIFPGTVECILSSGGLILDQRSVTVHG